MVVYCNPIELISQGKYFKECKQLCQQYHYSKTCPASKYYFCVYEWDYNIYDWELVGCLTYRNGANRNGVKQFGDKYNNSNCLELTRVCFKKHYKPISYYMSKINKYLKQKGIKLIYSYSDLEQNHTGTLYKACNFKLVGERKLNGDVIWCEVKQRWEHQRNYWNIFKKMKESDKDLTWKQFILLNNLKTKKQSNKLLWKIQLNA